MEYTVERFDAREWPDAKIGQLFSEGFPSLITADPVAAAYIKRVWEYFAEYHIMLVDSVDQPAASDWGVPIHWNGQVTDLPSGYTDTLRRAVKEYETKTPPNTFVICAGVVNPTFARQGVAGQLILELKELGKRHNLPRIIAPLRPTLKHQYPLTPIDTYTKWVRPDGLPFDP